MQNYLSYYEPCTLVVFYKLVQSVGSCLEFFQVVQMLRRMVFFQEFLNLQPIYVDDLGIASKLQEVTFDIIDDVATLCGMVIKDSKDVKNSDTLGFEIHS